MTVEEYVDRYLGGDDARRGGGSYSDLFPDTWGTGITGRGGGQGGGGGDRNKGDSEEEGDDLEQQAQEALAGLGVYTDPMSEEEFLRQLAEQQNVRTTPVNVTTAATRPEDPNALPSTYAEHLAQIEAANRAAGFIPEPDLSNLQTALSRYNDIYEGGGYTAAERAQMRQAQMEAASYEQSQRNAALQQLAMRGLSGSGVEAMIRGQSAQEGANRAARSADEIAIAGQDRAMRALSGYDTMATGILGAQNANDIFNAQVIQQGQLARAGQNVTLAGLGQQFDIAQMQRDLAERGQNIDLATSIISSFGSGIEAAAKGRETPNLPSVYEEEEEPTGSPVF